MDKAAYFLKYITIYKCFSSLSGTQSIIRFQASFWIFKRKQESLCSCCKFSTLVSGIRTISTVICCEDFTRQPYNKCFILSRTTKICFFFFFLKKHSFPFTEKETCREINTTHQSTASWKNWTRMSTFVLKSC